MHLQSPLVQQYIQSITTGYSVEHKYPSREEQEVSAFEKTYVSFPDLLPEEDSKTIELNTPKAMTAPSSYQFKPIWMSA
ncbi:hypothetical protein BD560DRAFT_439650 [Blakeslea trispora]|nr:hypothetical protein BD560DRAFT_439650 [Blakeslea trispora]